jgi:flagellar biosynthesis/type III secretory pathway protein FliH
MYVLYADHLEALRQAEQRTLDEYKSGWNEGWEQGQRDEYARTRADVEAALADGKRSARAEAVQRVEAAKAEFIRITDAEPDSWACRVYDDSIAAVKGGSDE